MASVGSDSGEHVSLNVMPMLDIFSILILFLLMSFSSDPVNHDLSEGVELPDSITLQSLDEVPTVILSHKEILVNDKSILPLVNGNLPASEKSQGAIHVLYEELEKVSASIKENNKNEKSPIALTLEIDKNHKFEFLKRVLLSGQQADFVTFKLMVSKQIN